MNTSTANCTPFMTIAAASKATGLSQYFIRGLCREGLCCVKSGNKFMVNVPALLRMLDAETEKESA